ncbi:MAG: LuxR C-terminal-related transcriptional regulator [Myxococcota bacterium]
MDRATSTIINMVEASYDLGVEDAAWLPHVMSVGLPLLDQGLGVGALEFSRPLNGEKVMIHQQYVASGPEDFPERNMRFTSEGDAELSQAMTRPGMAMTLTECAGEKYLDAVDRWRRYFDYSKDAFGVTAVDPDGQGIHIIAPLAEPTKLSARTRQRWQMIGAHLAAGHRLHRALREPPEATSELPHDAELVLDAKNFRTTEAAGSGRNKSAQRALREAAVAVDAARGRLRKSSPEEALAIWRGLSRGRWSVVDWFDTDGRRYVLGLKNPPSIRDPRALTERERQVATYAGLGESNKLIAYRLGLSESRVSKALQNAMQKLKTRNRAQLVARMQESARLEDNA